MKLRVQAWGSTSVAEIAFLKAPQYRQDILVAVPPEGGVRPLGEEDDGIIILISDGVMLTVRLKVLFTRMQVGRV